MRVGLIIYGDLGTISGGYRYDRHLVAALRAAGHTVEIISVPWRNYGLHLTDNLSGRLLAHLADLRLDIVLQDELNHPSLVLLNRRLCRRHAPIVAIVHHLRSDEGWPHPLRSVYSTVERMYLTSVDAFIFNSRATQRAVERHIAPDRPSCIAVPGRDALLANVTPDSIRARGAEPGPLRVLFVGNVIPRKGLHTLIDALARLPPGSWTLTVVGNLMVDRAYSRRIGSLIANAGLAPHIQLRGHVADTDLADNYRAAQVLAVPSAHEGFGIVYLEAMGYGLPVIATSSGGAVDLVSDGETGYLVPPAATDHIASALELLAYDRSRLIQMGLAAHDRFRRHPTWPETMARPVAFLEALVNQPRRQAAT